MPEIKKTSIESGEKSSLAENGLIMLEKSMTKQIDSGTYVKISVSITAPVNATNKFIKQAVATEKLLSAEIDTIMDSEWAGMLE